MTTLSVTSPWLTSSSLQSDATVRLFCFPYAGGSALVFRPWLTELPNNVDVCPVELPGRGSRFSESLCTQWPLLIQTCAQALLPYLDKPFALFGHSFGALLSFELAHILTQVYGKKPVHLFASGRQAPHLPDPSPMHGLSDTLLLQRLNQLNGTPQTVLDNPELLQLLLPVLRADLTLDEVYRYTRTSKLTCPITVLSGLQDPETSKADLCGWREHTTGSFSLNFFPGDHFFIHTAQTAVLKTLTQGLEYPFPKTP